MYIVINSCTTMDVINMEQLVAQLTDMKEQLAAQSKTIADVSAANDRLTDELKSKLCAYDETISGITSDNTRLRDEVTHLKTVVNRQATYIANLDVDLDELGQYGRRENVVFSNLYINDVTSPETQVVELCNKIGVTVHPSDIVACHVLPSKNDSLPKRVIARFDNRKTANKIFKNRKNAKKIPAENKAKLSANKDRGIGISPNLTVKRGKFFSQVKFFNETYGHQGCWVNPMNGKILIKLRGDDRGRVVRSTGDLTEINKLFVPEEWFFCAPPSFVRHADSVTPPVLSPNNASIFSPSTPSNRAHLTNSTGRNRGGRSRGNGNRGSGYRSPELSYSDVI